VAVGVGEACSGGCNEFSRNGGLGGGSHREV